MARIKITVDGEDQFDREFRRLDAQFEDLTPIWPDVRDEFWEIEKEQFASEGSSGNSGQWKKLSPAYSAQKVNQYGQGLKILHATGDLMRSLTGSTADTYYRTTKKEIAIGSTLERGVFHQRGGGKLPRRPPIDISQSQRKRLGKVIQASLVRELRKGSGYILPNDR